MSDFSNMVEKIYTNINNVFESEDSRRDFKEIDTEYIDEKFFTAELYAFCMQFNDLTEQDYDIIEFTHILNKLAIQNILEKND